MSGCGAAPNPGHDAAAKAGVVDLVTSLSIELGMYRLFAPDVAEPTTELVRPRHAGMNLMGVAEPVGDG